MMLRAILSMTLAALVFAALPVTVRAAPLTEDEVLTLFKKANQLGASGEHATAENLFLQVLPELPRLFGMGSVPEGSVLNNLAQLYQATGRPEQAEPLFKRSLEIREAKLGKDHPLTAT